MANSSFERLKELNLSRDEVDRIGEALKKQEFRQLLVDYVEEIQDPQNRQLYEEEIKQLERERGQEVTFLHPTAGYVIKTSINGDKKCFINVCSNENVEKPFSTPKVKDGAKGLQWSLPHSLAPGREDLDNKGVRCHVFDVLFHPNALHLASKNRDFCSMVNNVALDAIENNFNVNLDKKNLKFPKLSYKGMKNASLLRKPLKDKPMERSGEERQIYDKIYAQIDAQREARKGSNTKKQKCENDSSTPWTTPKFLIKHRNHIDIQDYTEHKNAKLNAAIPKELVVDIDLPLLKSSNDMNLDVTEKTIQLSSEKPAKYKLDITLPYQVDELNGTAKFDKDTKKLTITLPVRRRNSFESAKEDSGVESCIESDFTNHSGIESEDDDDDYHQENPLAKTLDNNTTQKPQDTFLNSNELYNLPDFTCNVFDNILAFTFNVKNVDESTMYKECSSETSLVKVKFTSLSSSFYPSSYAFYVKFPHHQIAEEEVNLEAWDNNVILHIPLKASGNQLLSYFYGINGNDLTEKYIAEPVIISKVLEQNDKLIDEVKLEVIKEDPDVVKEEPRKPKSEAIDILTSYESSGDELSAGSYSPRKSKGILKRFSDARAKFGRSASESSLDDFFCSSLEYHHESIECVPEDSKEEEEDCVSSSLRKTVRFNDVVTKQLFRSNSSILGQKKKNQRKARNKKRAHERRFSESEASDTESKKEGDDQTVGNTKEQPKDTDPDKRDDSDIFHLEINN